MEADKTNDHPRTGGVFQGSFKERRLVPRPIVDPEDNVTRCPNCSWELEEDECTHCGFVVDDDDDLTVTDSIEEDSQMSDLDVSDDFGDDIDDDTTWISEWGQDNYIDDPRLTGLPFSFGHRGEIDWHDYLVQHARTYHPDILDEERDENEEHDENEENEEEDEDDDDNDDEMDSFIDDEEIEDDLDDEHSTVVGDYRYHGATNPFSDVTRASLSEHSDHDEDEDDDNEDQESERLAVEDESSEEDQPIRLARSAGPIRHASGIGVVARQFANWSAQRPLLLTANNSAQSSCMHSRITQPGTSADTAINVEDDSEDGAPIPPTRRSRSQRQLSRQGYPY